MLLVGGRDFTMIGRPLLRRSLVKIEATVVEKTPGVEKIIQRFRPRKSFERKHSKLLAFTCFCVVNKVKHACLHFS